jgi:hypothetical protein
LSIELTRQLLKVIAGARELSSKGRWLEAAKVLETVEGLGGTDLLGRSYLLSEKGDCLHKAALAGPSPVAKGSGSLRGSRLDHNARVMLEEAEATLRQAVRANDGGRGVLGESFARMGAVLIDLTLPREAATALHKSVVIDSTLTDRHILLGGAVALAGDWAFASDCFAIAEALGGDPEEVLPGLPETALRRRSEPPQEWNVEAVALYFKDLDLFLIGLTRDLGRAFEHMRALKACPSARFITGVFGLVPLTGEQASSEYNIHMIRLRGSIVADTFPFTPEEARSGAVDATLGLGLFFIGATFKEVDASLLEGYDLAGMHVNWSVLRPDALRALPQFDLLKDHRLVLGRFTQIPHDTDQDKLANVAWIEYKVVEPVLRRMGLPAASSIQAIDCTEVLMGDPTTRGDGPRKGIPHGMVPYKTGGTFTFPPSPP